MATRFAYSSLRNAQGQVERRLKLAMNVDERCCALHCHFLSEPTNGACSLNAVVFGTVPIVEPHKFGIVERVEAQARYAAALANFIALLS